MQHFLTSPKSPMLTVAQVCDRLNIHEATVRRWIKAGTLKATLLGGTVWRIPESEIDRLIQEGQEAAHADLTDDLFAAAKADEISDLDNLDARR